MDRRALRDDRRVRRRAPARRRSDRAPGDHGRARHTAPPTPSVARIASPSCATRPVASGRTPTRCCCRRRRRSSPRPRSPTSRSCATRCWARTRTSSTCSTCAPSRSPAARARTGCRSACRSSPPRAPIARCSHSRRAGTASSRRAPSRRRRPRRGDACALAVVGAHLSGEPLNHQLVALGARLVETVTSAPGYRLFALPDTEPPKPGMVNGGPSDGPGLELEVWELPVDGFGRFVAGVPAPLVIGTVALERRAHGEGLSVRVERARRRAGHHRVRRVARLSRVAGDGRDGVLGLRRRAAAQFSIQVPVSRRSAAGSFCGEVMTPAPPGLRCR